MQIGSCHGRITKIVFNTFQTSEKGLQILISSEPILLPIISEKTVPEAHDTMTHGQTRKSKGTNLLPQLRNLLSSSNFWFNIEVTDDYY